MDFTHWTYEEREGLPPNGESGLYLGYNVERFAFVMWWHTEAECWVGVGLDPKAPRQMPMVFQAKGDMAEYITRHAALPWPYPWAKDADAPRKEE